jgi:hypothetical protein
VLEGPSDLSFVNKTNATPPVVGAMSLESLEGHPPVELGILGDPDFSLATSCMKLNEAEARAPRAFGTPGMK